MIVALALAALAQEPVDFRDHVDQARFYLKKEWYVDAANELEAAVATEDGRLDPEAWFLLAQVRYALGDLLGARQAADRAYVHSREASQEEQTSDFVAHLHESFGVLVLEPPRESVSTTLELELRSRVLDPELKRWVADVAARLDRTVPLPVELGLPAGTYTVNGETVEVRGGERTTLVPPIRGRSVAWQTLRVEGSVGASAWFGEATRAMLPAVTVGLAAGVPVGPLELAAVGDWTPRAVALADGGLLLDPLAFAAGVRVGVELRGDEPLRLRPAVSWRYGTLPGVQIPCARDADDTWTCRGEGTAPELYVVPLSRVHRIGAEVAATWLPRDRRSGLGGGVRLICEGAMGALPEEAVAREVSSDAVIPYAVIDRTWTAVGVRVLLDLTYAF